jgi:hypothetical protein
VTVAVDVAELDLATDGITKAFNLTGPSGALILMSVADLAVWFVDATGAATQLAAGADYAITGDVRAGLGVLTTLAADAYAAGGKLAVRRTTPRIQPEAWAENDGFSAKLMQNVQDRGRLIDQDLAAMGARAIRAPASETSPDLILPSKAERLGKVLSFDAVTGDPTVSDPMVTAAQQAAADAMASAAAAGADLWSRPVALASNAPDAVPAIGMRRLVWLAPTGAWAGHAYQVTEYFSDGWHFSGAPAIGQTVFLSDGSGWLSWNGAAYTTLGNYVDTVTAQTVGGAKTFSDRAVLADGADVQTSGYGMRLWNTTSYDIRMRPIGAGRRSEIVLVPNDVDGTEDTAGGEFTALSRDEVKYGAGNALAFVLFYDRSADKSRLMAHAFGTSTQTGITVDPMGGINITDWDPSTGAFLHHGHMAIDCQTLPHLTLQSTTGNYPAMDFADAATAPAATFRLRVNEGKFDVVHVDTGRVPFQIDNDSHPLFANAQTTASAANAYIDPTTGELTRNTSTEAIKADITPLGESYIGLIDRLQPVSFHSVALMDDPVREYIGFTAQNAAEADVRLAECDAGGEPIKPNTDAILALLVLEVQRLKAEIRTLKGP